MIVQGRTNTQYVRQQMTSTTEFIVTIPMHLNDYGDALGSIGFRCQHRG